MRGKAWKSRGIWLVQILSFILLLYAFYCAMYNRAICLTSLTKLELGTLSYESGNEKLHNSYPDSDSSRHEVRTLYLQSFVMMYIKLLNAVSTALCAIPLSVLGAAIKEQSQASFVNPANIYRPTVRYWLPDASVSTDILRRDIESLAKVGLGGFEFLPFYLYGLPTPGVPPPTDWNKYGYGTPAYKNVFNAAIDASGQNNLLMSFAIGANQGQGSPAKMESTGLAKELAYASILIPSGGKFSGQLPLPVDHPPGQSGLSSFMHESERRIEQKLIAVVAARIEKVTTSGYFIQSANLSIPVNNTYLEENSLAVITSNVAGGKINFNPPKEGNWQIFVFYERYTNQKSCSGALTPDSIIGNGSWIVDHFSDTGAQVTTDFIDQYVLDSKNQKKLAKVGQYAWEDSLEMHAPAWWTPDFLAKFKTKRGYDLTKYLPFIFNGENTWGQTFPPYINRTYLGSGTDGGQGANDDYRTTLTELNQKYIDHMEDWAHQQGLQFSNQPAYNLPLDMAAQMPFVDTPETESLGFPTIDKLRQFTGAAHISQKRIISSETGALTKDASAYSQNLPELLVFVNEQLVAGVNMFVLHGTPYSGEYVQTTWPAYTAFYYNVPEMHSSCQPAWKDYKYTIDYIARNSLISQTGTAKIDVAFLLSDMAFTFPELDSVSLTSAGYSYEYVGPTNLDLETATIQNNLLSPAGPAFKALVVDGNGSYPYQVASKLEEYAKKGFPIIFLGKSAAGVSSVCLQPCNTKAFQTRLSNLVSQYPKTVKVASSVATLDTILTSIGVKPRVVFTSRSWYYTMWKSSSDSKTDFVYFYNQNSAAEASFSVEFSKTKYPYRVDAWTGTYSPIVDLKRNGSSISLKAKLLKGATTIIAFTDDQNFNGQRSPAVSVIDSGTNVLGFSSRGGGIIAQVVGNSSVTLSSGKVVAVQANVPTASTLPNWNVTIEDWHPTSDISSMVTEITNHTILDTELKPWTDYNLPNVSGIGHYTTSFSLSSTDAILSLGPIQNTVRVYLNGRELPPIDLFNTVIDISDYSRKGVNQLQIDISTTLFNAVKSRSNSIKTAGASASVTNSRLAESAPSAKYGLLGPVVVTPFKAVSIA